MFINKLPSFQKAIAVYPGLAMWFTWVRLMMRMQAGFCCGGNG